MKQYEETEKTPELMIDEENYDTGDASLDNVRNEDEIGEKELLALSFGTSFNDNRRLTIGAIEEELERAFPDYAVRRGFTSQIIINHIKARDKVAIDNVEDALKRAIKNGVKSLIVQPTHLMSGVEYQELAAQVSKYSNQFEQVALGEPLLSSDADFTAVVKAMAEDTRSYDDGETAICLMGHGTEDAANQVYERLQGYFEDMGYCNYYVATVEASPTLEDLLAMVKKKAYRRVILQPLMIVAGDHANNDMAGEEEGSWKSTFEREGYQVVCVLRGMGELEAIRTRFAAHARAAVEGLER